MVATTSPTVAQTAPGINMNTGGGYGNFQSSGLPATSNVFTVNGENDMDPFLNLNNSGATNLTLGRNVHSRSNRHTKRIFRPVRSAGRGADLLCDQVGYESFHGNAEYWWTGRAMDANDWFNNNTNPVTPRPFANNVNGQIHLAGPLRKINSSSS